MLLGNKAIDAALKAGHIVCKPLQEGAIQAVSIDVRLGNHFIDKNGSATFLTPGAYLLHPGQTILAHTLEVIGSTVNWIRPKICGKSTLARHFLQVEVTAAGIAPGYVNHVTLELVNHSSESIKLIPGMEIGQVEFERIEGCDLLYSGDYGKQGEPDDWMRPRPIKYPV